MHTRQRNKTYLGPEITSAKSPLRDQSKFNQTNLSRMTIQKLNINKTLLYKGPFLNRRKKYLGPKPYGERFVR